MDWFAVYVILLLALLSTVIAIVLAFHLRKYRAATSPNDPFAIWQAQARRAVPKAMLVILSLTIALSLIDLLIDSELRFAFSSVSLGLLFFATIIIAYWVRPKNKRTTNS